MDEGSLEATSTTRRLGIYRRLAGFPVIRHSYARKFAYAAFVGAQVPLLVFILLLLVEPPNPSNIYPLVAALALACLAGFLGTLSLVRDLLVPVELTAEALQAFLNHKRLPDLPTSYRDAAGRLMEGTQYTLAQLDETIRKLEGISSTDVLTGIYNRRAGEQRLAEDVARAERYGEAFEFAFIDMNRFKEINDSLGHAAGDACIRHVAQKLTGSIRAGDWAARWGGDEFVVALHRNHAPEKTFERIVGTISTAPCVLDDGREIKLAVSAGVATYRIGQGVAGFVADADRAMYSAKELSRQNGQSNICHFAEPTPVAPAA